MNVALALRFLPELGGLGLALLLFLIAVVIGHEADGASEEELQQRRNRSAAIAQKAGLFGSILVLVFAGLAVLQDGPLFFGAYDAATSQLKKRGV